ncbi:MAG TPA: hypothetical protein VNT20_00420 [Flavisolibacter sp.]|jgi:hypothetical protein|nr:hypothetical protein [Flavisolibacter sp.]
MKQSQSTYSGRQIFSGLFMIVTLLWLTVSTPFVFKAQQEQKKEAQGQSKQSDNTNPFSNTTEEKNESSVNTLSEYLHEPPTLENNFIVLTTLYKLYSSKIYLAHHPELLSPPPES